TAKEKQMQKSLRTMSRSAIAPAAPAFPVPSSGLPEGLQDTAPESPAFSGNGQAALDTFREAVEANTPRGPRIVIDDRETSSKVVEVLSDMGAAIRLERLPHGDFAIGDRILAERKTARDFVDTLIERDLLGQVKAMAEASTRPILIIEGGDLYAQRDIHPNAIKGVLAALTVDMGVSLLYTKDAEDTAQMLFVIAKREESERGERKVHPHKSYRSVKEEQEYIISAFPEIGLRNARILLSHFGSVQAIVNASLEELVAVRGIGEKTAQRIFELSRREYGG
ncbi:MAG TPA: ERCC4 domain-containing protein, partial [Methanoregula sp.]|nr:ERCC4 domain-containing protein [Methanoregula sp.]